MNPNLVLLTLGLKMYKRIPFGDSGIAETLVGIAISLAYQPIVRRAPNLYNQDYYQWIKEIIKLLEQRNFQKLDLDIAVIA